MDALALPPPLADHLASLRVAVYGSGGAPSHHLALLAHWGIYPHVVYAADILAGHLDEYNAVIFPSGGLASMAGQLTPLGEHGMRALRRWVGRGGSYLGFSAGSCHPLRMGEVYRSVYPETSSFQLCDVTPLNAAAGVWGLDSLGTGRIRVEPETTPLFAGLEEPFEIVYYSGPLFPDVSGASGRLTGSTEAFTPFEVSQGQTSGATLLARALAQGARVVYRQYVEAGQVILFGPHPEFGSSALQLGFLPAVRLLVNALGLVQARPRALAEPEPSVLKADILRDIAKEVALLEVLLADAAPLGTRLPPQTPSFLGLSGSALWDAALIEARDLLASLRGWLVGCRADSSVRGLHLLDTAPKAGQDVGFSGVRQGLGRARGLAQRALGAPWIPFSGAYDELVTHPYHLLVSSYLSACGLVAAAALQVSAFASLNALPSLAPTLLGDLRCRKNVTTVTNPSLTSSPAATTRRSSSLLN